MRRPHFHLGMPFKITMAEYEIIMIGEGKNVHTVDKQPINRPLYEDSRFVIPRNVGDKIHGRVRFIVPYIKEGEQGKMTPVNFGKSEKASSEVLYNVHSSTRLSSALMNMLHKPFSFGFGGRKILFVGIIIIVGVVGYFVYTGQFNLGGLIKTS